MKRDREGERKVLFPTTWWEKCEYNLTSSCMASNEISNTQVHLYMKWLRTNDQYGREDARKGVTDIFPLKLPGNVPSDDPLLSNVGGFSSPPTPRWETRPLERAPVRVPLGRKVIPPQKTVAWTILKRERGKEGRKKKNGAVTSSVHLVIIVVVAEGAAIIDSITNQQSEALLRIQDGGRTKNISLK